MAYWWVSNASMSNTWGWTARVYATMSSSIIIMSEELQVLLQENEMKTAAVSKASTLIDLLNIQLEVERKSTAEAIAQAVAQAEHQLTQQYHTEIKQLQRQVEILEDKLRQSNEGSIGEFMGSYNGGQLISTQVKRGMQTALKNAYSTLKGSRNEEFTQPLLRKDRSVSSAKSKKITHFNAHQSRIIGKQKSKTMVEPSLKELVALQHQERTLLERQIARLVKQERQYVEQLRPNADGAHAILEYRPMVHDELTHLNRRIRELGQIVREQQQVIVKLRQQASTMDGLLRECLNLWEGAQTWDYNWDYPLSGDIWPEDTIQELMITVRRKRQEWRNHCLSLERQNKEIKNLMDSMIALVKRGEM